MEGDPLRETSPSVPPWGVFFTVKAPFASDAAAPSDSLKLTFSVVSYALAVATVGRTPSTIV